MGRGKYRLPLLLCMVTLPILIGCGSSKQPMPGDALVQEVLADKPVARQVAQAPVGQTPVANGGATNQPVAEVDPEMALGNANSPGPSTGDSTSSTNIPADRAATGANGDSGFTRFDALMAGLSIFVLAVFVGFEVITKVPPTLHTPLMSGSNAISGITLVGALLVAGQSDYAAWLGVLAIVFAMINVIGGFWVTHRMLSMFKR